MALHFFNCEPTSYSRVEYFSLNDFVPAVILSFFFFLMIRRPPRSTPFPTRRSSDLDLGGDVDGYLGFTGGGSPVRTPHALVARSEEHTSELQSRGHLVCRLLLEKKNKVMVCVLFYAQKKQCV